METRILKLSIKDRISFRDILPAEGSYIEMILIKSIQNIVEITPEDISRHNMKQLDGRIEWSNDEDRPFEFTPEQFEIILQAIKRIDSDKKVNVNNFNLVQKVLETNNQIV